MHRIDSATARADANGAGKAGFSDNGDLPNQDATYFTPDWANSLQEEVANVIEEFGIDLDKNNNGQLLAALVKQFAEKKALEDAIKNYDQELLDVAERLEELESRTYEDTQIGQHIWVSQHFLTPEAVTTYKGYGTWERALQGRVAVGFSDNASDDVRFRTSNDEYGESEVTLTIDQMPSHRHPLKHGRDNGSVDNHAGTVASDTDNWSSEYIPDTTNAAIGGDQPHSNIQQSKTLDCWKRVA